MSIKLTAETTVTIDHNDLCAILTDHLCRGSYGAFSELAVTIITEDVDNPAFTLALTPIPREQAA